MAPDARKQGNSPVVMQAEPKKKMGIRTRLSRQAGVGLVEILMVIVLLGLLMVAAAPLANTTYKSTNATTDRVEGLAQARLGLNRMVRELRSASKLVWHPPTVSTTSWPATTPPYTTNYIDAVRVIPAEGPAPITVSYVCGWVPGGSQPSSTFCLSIYLRPGGGVALNWYLPIAPSSSHSAQLFNPTATNPAVEIGGQNTEAFGVFTLSWPQGLDPTNPNHLPFANRVDIRLLVCPETQRCTHTGSEQPVELTASASPRNITPPTECQIDPGDPLDPDNPCSDADPATDPEGEA